MAAYGEGWDLLRRTQWGYATHPNLGAALMVGLGCEVFQIDRMKDEYGMVEGDHFQTMTIQATGGTQKNGRARPRAHQGHVAGGGARETRNPTRFGDRAGAAMRRLGRLFRHHGKSRRSGAAVDLAGQTWRHGGAGGNAGDLRRRASADAARGQSRGRRKTGRAHPLVGGLHKAQWRRDEQQPGARQQGGRADHHPGKITGRRRQGRHHHIAGRLRICRAGEGKGLRVHGHARLRPGRRHRPGCRRQQRHVLHHGPRIRFRLQAHAVASSSPPIPRCTAA